jgi:hypothetical protein
MDKLLKASRLTRAITDSDTDTKIMGGTHSKNIRAALLVAWNSNEPTRALLKPRDVLIFYPAGQVVIDLYCNCSMLLMVDYVCT